ncbi:MAG: hypothetical protein Q9211_001440 [Gyalolechia sp. 1 TL-2023]
MKRPSEKTLSVVQSDQSAIASNHISGPSPESATPKKRQKPNVSPEGDTSKNIAQGRTRDPNSLFLNAGDEHEDTKENIAVTPKAQPRKRKPSAEAEGRIIVAVDFGTTYSGLFWAQTKMPETWWPIDQWPNSPNGSIDSESRAKVPTELQYTVEGFNWGFQIPLDAQRLQWFKLKLCPSKANAESDLAMQYPDGKAAVPGEHQTPETLAKDYLSALRKHFEAVLLTKIPPSVASTTRVEYVITVPAMWTEAAVAKTRECAEKAGMGEGSALQIVSEPEAAAVYALHVAAPFDLAVGDTFVVCDAGGGTVDLITYRVTARGSIVRVVEVGSGRGDQCGSIFLNRRFEKFLREKLSDHHSWREDMMEEVDSRVNRSDYTYHIAGIDAVRVRVPGFTESKALDVHRARFLLKGSDLFELFEPVINRVLKLVTDQIATVEGTNNPTVKAVLMVGGFGENTYLNERLRQALIGRSIGVWKTANAWTAVLRGALMKGMAQACPKSTRVGISGRLARSNYGTESAKVYDESVHEATRRFWSDANNRHEVNTFDWFILKGDTLTEKKPIRFSYHVERLITLENLDPVEVSLVKCEVPEGSAPPVLVGDGQVQTLATIQVPIDRIPTRHLQKRRSAGGQQWYIIDFMLRVTCSSAEMTYELTHKRENYGRIALDYV